MTLKELIISLSGVMSISGSERSSGEKLKSLIGGVFDEYRTDALGTIIATSDGTSISFSWASGGTGPVTPAGSRPSLPNGSIPAVTFIGNKNTKKTAYA